MRVSKEESLQQNKGFVDAAWVTLFWSYFVRLAYDDV
jgi:hypothetical protein